jgi:hypothetical protein
VRCLLPLVVLFSAATAGAQEKIDVRALRYAERGEYLVVSGTFTDAFDPRPPRAALERLRPDGGGAPLGLPDGQRSAPLVRRRHLPRGLRRLDEVYLVRLRDPAGERNLRFTSRAEALKALTTLDNFPLVPLDAPPGRARATSPASSSR